MIKKIGFMQGRLSEMVGGKIQAFPWNTWQDEIRKAKSIDLCIMEWTLDQENLYQNPLMTVDGQDRIRELCANYEFSIPSLTGDCFMQSPFWKIDNEHKVSDLKKDFISIIMSCSLVGITLVVVPLVDNGAIESREQEDLLVSFLNRNSNIFDGVGVKILFESDFCPRELARFISRLNPNTFGINYDSGNSAALGWDPYEEISLYGDRILNVHIKDRPFRGGTVPLGDGDVIFPNVISLLKSSGYDSNFILQTARANDGRHAEELYRYKNYLEEWLS